MRCENVDVGLVFFLFHFAVFLWDSRVLSLVFDIPHNPTFWGASVWLPVGCHLFPLRVQFRLPPIFSDSSLPLSIFLSVFFFLSFMAVVLWLFMCAISRCRTIAARQLIQPTAKVVDPGSQDPESGILLFLLQLQLHLRVLLLQQNGQGESLLSFTIARCALALLYCLAKRNRLLIYLAIQSTKHGAKHPGKTPFSLLKKKQKKKLPANTRKIEEKRTSVWECGNIRRFCQFIDLPQQ